MTKITAPAAVKLTPEYVADETAALEAAFNGIRRRPVLARTEAGELVVCCNRTARKHGWKVEGKLFPRTKAAKAPTVEQMLGLDK